MELAHEKDEPIEEIKQNHKTLNEFEKLEEIERIHPAKLWFERSLSDKVSELETND